MLDLIEILKQDSDSYWIIYDLSLENNYAFDANLYALACLGRAPNAARSGSGTLSGSWFQNLRVSHSNYYYYSTCSFRGGSK